MTETSLVQVVCPDCRRKFDVPDGAAEAQCPQCGEQLVWRSCLDTNEVFTVLKKWETWIHPGCDTKHPVDLTHVISAARPQGLDPTVAPVPPFGTEPGGEQTVYSPIELADDVEWADQDISGRLIVDSDRLAILPGAGVARPPLSVAWVRDVTDYVVHRADPDAADTKKRRFGRRKDQDGAVRPTLLVLSVPGGQIAITATSQPDMLLGRLDEFLRPRIGAPEVQQSAAPVIEQPAPQQPVAEQPVAEQPAAPDVAPPVETEQTPAAPEGQAAPQGLAGVDPANLPDLEPETPEAVYESIRKLAELAVLGSISSEEFATKKAQLLARL